MPPKKTVIQKDHEEEEHQPTTPTKFTTTIKTTDCDRIQLAQALNNFNVMSENFLNEMKNFDQFREKIYKLDLQLEAKKKEFQQTTEKLESDHAAKKAALEAHYAELSKKSLSDHTDKTKKCESDFADKHKALSNAYEDESINMKRKMDLDKTKACTEYAKSLNYRFVKEDEYKQTLDSMQKALNDYNELKKTFDKQCAQIREDEKAKYRSQLDNDNKMMDLTNKASNAQLTAQVDQQLKEIKVLNSTIENLKSELKEQRELTKQVAQASAKSQISQNFGKN